MTRRERLEARLERRQDWADKAAQRSQQHATTAHQMADAIPLGQPILVGHYSEKRDRRYRERIGGHASKSVEESDKAAHHIARAGGIADQLDRSIFSDDPDAVEAIEARIAALETKRDAMKAANATATLPLCNYRAPEVVALNRFHGTDDLRLRQVEMTKAEYAAMHKDRRATYAVTGSHRVRGAMIAHELVCVFLTDSKAADPPPPAESAPKKYQPYQLTNLGAEIRRNRERLEEIKTRQARAAAAAAAVNGVTIEGTGDYVTVTFEDKPDRDVIEALRSAGYRWGGGSWHGLRANLPAAVRSLTE